MRKMLLGLAAAVAISVGALSLDAATDEEDNPTALAGAMSGVKTTLEAGLKASEREGEPISAKFEIEDGKLQLSIYTATDKGFVETVLDPATAAIVKAERITEADDLKEANIQSGSMATASRSSLLTTTAEVVKANAGFGQCAWCLTSKKAVRWRSSPCCKAQTSRLSQRHSTKPAG